MSQLDLFRPQRQFDLFAPPPAIIARPPVAAPTPAPTPAPKPAPAPKVAPTGTGRPRDELGERIIAAGLAPNDYIMSINHGLGDYSVGTEEAWPWCLPSRLFRFPIETNGAERDYKGNWHPRTIGLLHPALADHPFVKKAEAALGEQISRDPAPNIHGHSKASLGRWWHAVDLMTEAHWRDLMKTAEFTDPGCILRAICFALGIAHSSRKGGQITTKTARAIMAEFGSIEPDAATIAEAMAAFSLDEFEFEGKRQRPINGGHKTPELQAWAYIVAIERGWFAYRSGHLTWTDKAKDGEETLL